MKKIKLYYYNETYNFGDQLNVKLFENLFNLKVEYTEPQNADVVAIGSLLENFLTNQPNRFKIWVNQNFRYKPILVYGTGFMADKNHILKRKDDWESSYRKLIPHAVRGFYTKDRIEKINMKAYSDIPVGDPGILASYLTSELNISKKYSLGIIPHYVDKENAVIKELSEKINYSKIINIQDNPLEVIKQISECEIILSTAMHGLIVSDSLGIPNKWLKVSDNLFGGDYKFKDYYSAFNLFPEPLILEKAENINLQEIAENYKITKTCLIKIQDNLFNAGKTLKEIIN